MYELTVEREFCAAHAIRIGAMMEPVHGHNWRVKATIVGGDLDANGLLVDFHKVERLLDRVIAPFHNAYLNAAPPFDAVNPTAELVAKEIGARLIEHLPRGVVLTRLSVTEAPGCTAAYIPD